MEAVGHPWAARAMPRGFAARLENESPWLAALALYAVVVLIGLGKLLAPDSWLSLVAGREVAESGPPTHDMLTTWAAGSSWVDQQWFGQLVLYGLASAGGLRAALVVGAGALVATLAMIAISARSRGASPGSVAVIVTAAMVVNAASTALRTEILVYPLFVGVVWLARSDARRPSSRVLAVLPILVLWANVHGSVLLGGALVALYGLFVVPKRRAAGIALLAAPAAIAVTPYRLESLEYVRSTAGNRLFPHLLEEWQRTSFPANWRFFAFAIAAGWLVARARRLTVFDRIAFLALLFAALVATRYTVWFVLYAAMLLPPLLDDAWKRRSLFRRRTTASLAAAGFVAVAAALVVVLARPVDQLRAAYPQPVERVVATELARDGSLDVFANEMYADWLLYTVPATRGRIAYDTRFELLSDDQLATLIQFNARAEGWRAALRGHDLLVLDTGRQSDLIARLASDARAKTLYADENVTVIRRR